MSSKDAAGRAHSCFPFGALTQAKQPVLDLIRPSAGLIRPSAGQPCVELRESAGGLPLLGYVLSHPAKE